MGEGSTEETQSYEWFQLSISRGFESHGVHLKMTKFLQKIPHGYKNSYAVFEYNKKTSEIGKLIETNDNFKTLLDKHGNKEVIYGTTQIKKNAPVAQIGRASV